MPTSIPLHPLAADALKTLQTRLDNEHGAGASERRIVYALIYGATPEQTVGMLNAFVKAKAEYEREQADADANDSDE